MWFRKAKEIKKITKRLGDDRVHFQKKLKDLENRISKIETKQSHMEKNTLLILKQFHTTLKEAVDRIYRLEGLE